MLHFRQMKSLQKFAAVHSSIHRLQARKLRRRAKPCSLTTERTDKLAEVWLINQ